MSKEINAEFFKELLFGNTLRWFRAWKIKRYKANKVKTEAKVNPEKMYHMHFKVSIRDKDGGKQSDTVFDIQIPANGYFYAKKKLEQFVIRNIDVEVIDFKSVDIEDDSDENEVHFNSEDNDNRS